MTLLNGGELIKIVGKSYPYLRGYLHTFKRPYLDFLNNLLKKL